MRLHYLAITLLLGISTQAFGQSAGSVNLTGPSTVPGAPQITPAAVNSAINTALTLKADATNGILTTPSIIGALTAGANVNVTGANPYQVDGVTVLDLLANNSSAIKSPEVYNLPFGGAAYIPTAIVQGYRESLNASSPSEYSSTVTVNATLTGTMTNHYGAEERTLHLINGGSGILSAELNQEKSYTLIDAGVSVPGAAEIKELMYDNSGSMGFPTGMLIDFVNESTGTITGGATGITLLPYNYNTTAGSFGGYTGLLCKAQAGPGPAPAFSACISNGDPNSTIVNSGHYSSQPAGGAPTLSGCGGGTPSLASRSSDTSGTVTEGTSATGCVIAFKVNYAGAAPICVVSSPTGNPYTGYTTASGNLTIVNASASGNQYNYLCFGSF